MTKRLLELLLLLLLLCAAVVRAADPDAARAIKAAQAYRAHGEPVVAAPDGTLFCEAEEFKVTSPGWKAQPWGENDHAATIVNTFLSRKAFLGAPAQCNPAAVATLNVTVPAAGRYLVLARYEAAFRFQTRFTIKIAQEGRTVFERQYGARENVKIWWDGLGRVTEPPPNSWTLNQSTVWEGHQAYADLRAGPAAISLIAGAQPEDAAQRNVDVIMLTRDEEQVKERLAKESYLPLDGWLTQAGDVWLRVANPGETVVTVKSLPFQEHSPYWVHMRKWQPINVQVAPGQTSGWIDVGGTMDTLNDGQWGFQTSAPCALTFGARDAAGRIGVIRAFEQVNGRLDLVGFADVRYSRKIATPREMNADLLGYLQRLPVHGKAPSQSMIIASGGWSDDEWRVLNDLYGFNGSLCNGPTGYVDWRGQTPDQLEETCRKLSEQERRNIAIVSLGDEINLAPPAGEKTTEDFIAFLKTRDLTPAQVDPAAGGWQNIRYNGDPALRETNPGIYYWSARYRFQYGIRSVKALTDALRKYLPNAGIGANFAPHSGYKYNFLPQVFQWVTCFREEGMTQPWSEGYAWRTAIGSPQMNSIVIDMMRAATRGRPEEKIHYYVMPHCPGNTPNAWRRLFYSSMGHGTKIFNLFEFDPVWIAYTENHVTGKPMYAEVLNTLREYGLYEDIVQRGQVRPSNVALWFSETADIWDDYADSGGAAKRALYVAILGRQMPLDFLVEQDALDGTLDGYKVLYLTDRHVSQAASGKIAAWVRAGGRLFATAGAGMFDEYNRPNALLRELLGVDMREISAPPESRVDLIKQDLAFVDPADTVAGKVGRFPVYGAVGSVAAASDAAVLGAFGDGSPAITQHAVDKGEAFYCAFQPGLSYFKPAIPKRPMAVSSRDDAMNHFIPSDFDSRAGTLVGLPLQDLLRPVRTSNPLVEATVIEADTGMVVTLTNWSQKPVKGLRVTLNIPVPAGQASLASGKPLKVSRRAGQAVYTLDVPVAETLIYR